MSSSRSSRSTSTRDQLRTAIEDVTTAASNRGPATAKTQVSTRGPGASSRTGPPSETPEQLKKADEIVKSKEVHPDDYRMKGDPTGRRLFVMRHAERLDRMLPNWLQNSFQSGNYIPYDLNMPIALPHRKSVKDFHNDPPITEIGFMTAQMVGRAFAVNKHRITHIYSSPALRCVQTAHAFMRAYQRAQNVKIRIEPGFFDWMGFFEQDLPEWLTMSEYRSLNLPVDEAYKPVMPAEMIHNRRYEFGLDFGLRLTKVIDIILDQSKDASGILVVGHATTVDGMARKLRGREVKAMEKDEMEKLGCAYPYCCVAGLEELTSKIWRSLRNPVPAISYVNSTSHIDYNVYNR